MQIRFGTAMSSHFSISNGVKQGGVLSLILFTIYIDNLIIQLMKFNIGCKIGNSFLGVFGYADDLTLLCPSLAGLKQTSVKIMQKSIIFYLMLQRVN